MTLFFFLGPRIDCPYNTQKTAQTDIFRHSRYQAMIGIFLWCVVWFSTLGAAAAAVVSAATTHEFYYKVQYVLANPDGVYEKEVISFNGTWPLPTIEVNKGDRVKLHLINGLEDSTTSLHFHGLFMKGVGYMDGPVGVTQCPISPGSSMLYDFKVEQSGTYWYHSHSGSQYSDGLRGLFIIHDEEQESKYTFDKQLSWSVSDWYHLPSAELVKKQLTRYNPTGAEPIPQNLLFNDSRNVTIGIDYDTTYLIRIANIGIMVSQFFCIPGYEFEIVEVDGVYTEPKKAKLAYLTVGQRMSILLKTKSKSDAKSNVIIVTSMDRSMLDTVPADLELNSINYLVYDESIPMPKPPSWIDDQDSFEPINDLDLVPSSHTPLLAEPDHRISLLLHMENLGDGVNYAFFNNYTYVAPKVPTLLTALSAPDSLVNDARIYGSNTNSFVLKKDETVEIVINNEDDNKHPMHLHGHQFQIIARSEDFEEPVHYDPGKQDSFAEFPIMRDTVYVEGNGYLVIRFMADNPGVWFFHCHLDFHLEQGLAVTLVEAPDYLGKYIPDDHLQTCVRSNMPTKGNAAGNDHDFLNLHGEYVQPAPLPAGFTPKGYFALFACTAAALYGIWSIYVFGMNDISVTEVGKIDNEKRVMQKYIEILERLKMKSVESRSEEPSAEIEIMLKQVIALNNKLSQL